MTQSVQPIQQPVLEDLRNCLQIAELWGQPDTSTNARARAVFRDIARLIRHALDQLGEPNLASVQAAATMLREYEAGSNAARDRAPRDAAAVILRAAVTGEIPPTWEKS